MKTFLSIAALAALSLPLSAQVMEQPMTRQQGDAILQELKQIRQLLDRGLVWVELQRQAGVFQSLFERSLV